MSREVRTVETSLLEIAYEVSGPEGGSPVILVHGWPDDVRTWDAVLPELHAAGLRTYVPYLRGFGPTRFRDPGTARSGQLSALGADLIEFANTLELGRFALVGHDWGARACYIASSLAGPSRVTHCVALSVGWGTNDPNQKLSLQQVQNYWYHWYMALDRGGDLVRNDRKAFTRYIWSTWFTAYQPSDDEFDATAASFDNPDWADVVLDSYRVRWGLVPNDPHYDGYEQDLTLDSTISVPTLVLHGAVDPCNSPATSAGREVMFKGAYERVLLDGVGHFPQREAPSEVAGHLVAFFKNR